MILNIVNLLFFFTSVITMKFFPPTLLEHYLDEFTAFSVSIPVNGPLLKLVVGYYFPFMNTVEEKKLHKTT